MAAEYSMDEIRREYIESKKKISYRDLAKKHGAPLSYVSAKGSEEHWVEQRDQYWVEIGSRKMEQVCQAEADCATQVHNTAKSILGKLQEWIDSQESITPSEAKGCSSTVKDIKDILMIRSAEDIEEQKARIEKLRRDADRDDRSASITVTLEGAMAEYGR